MGVEIDLSGRVVLVTGGTRGIGAGISEVLLRAGARVHVCSRGEPERLPEHDGVRAEFVQADVRDPEQVDGLIDEVVRRDGRLDSVVNNAGGAPPADTATASPRFHSKIVELNLLAPLLVCQRAWPVMRDSGGSMTMISSVAAQRAAPTIAAYAAAKAGVESLTRTLALEFAPSVRVNAVSVGVARTDNFREHFGAEAEQSGFAETIPMGRPAEPVEVGNACAFLASPLAEYLTGAVLAVDGGGEPHPHLKQLAREFSRD
ncbi:SDR family oxidoreductase [Saccharopolyspora sp. HNM0986]|uniref:SDR family oxidoreductase n=1 Tax=Saccharopolyspora galaxeae TaxID=2781241 RepID=UPI00190A9569|nr:SDR family oxidoreductase [Saccharopolyspora sp. HNM0986]MBK0866554.1 SDR family oxidoreductase [Saccharopolyspora sp. HNM0986]